MTIAEILVELDKHGALYDIVGHMEKIYAKMTDPLFTYDRNGLRLAIAALEDETDELYDEWKMHKRALGNCVPEVRHELLDIISIGIITYLRTFDAKG